MKITYIIAIVIIVLILWSLWGYFSSNVEQPQYQVIKKADDYEIRAYSARIVAQATVSGSYSESLNQGFRIVAGYIFGGNTKKQSIAMTAPVIEQSKQAEKIAMTAPVTASVEGDSHVISFTMPSSYTLATLPTPTDSRVKLVEVPPQKMAVIRFSWFRTDARVLAMKSKLLESLARDGIKVIGTPQYAGYNAPWTPPWMLRNEVMIEIQ